LRVLAVLTCVWTDLQFLRLLRGHMPRLQRQSCLPGRRWALWCLFWKSVSCVCFCQSDVVPAWPVSWLPVYLCLPPFSISSQLSFFVTVRFSSPSQSQSSSFFLFSSLLWFVQRWMIHASVCSRWRGRWIEGYNLNVFICCHACNVSSPMLVNVTVGPFSGAFHLNVI